MAADRSPVKVSIALSCQVAVALLHLCNFIKFGLFVIKQHQKRTLIIALSKN